MNPQLEPRGWVTIRWKRRVRITWNSTDCVQLDIQRFDDTLESQEPWTGQDEDWFTEASALVRLSKDERVYKELESALESRYALERQGRESQPVKVKFVVNPGV